MTDDDDAPEDPDRDAILARREKFERKALASISPETDDAEGDPPVPLDEVLYDLVSPGPCLLIPDRGLDRELGPEPAAQPCLSIAYSKPRRWWQFWKKKRR